MSRPRVVVGTFLAAGMAALSGVVVSAAPALAAASTCDYGASPGPAVRARLQRDGFTYLFLHCTRFGRAYYAFADDTSDARHPILKERVLVVAGTTQRARSAAAYFRSRAGRAAFLRAFKTFVSRSRDQFDRSVRLISVSLTGTIVRIEATARASPR